MKIWTVDLGVAWLKGAKVQFHLRGVLPHHALLFADGNWHHHQSFRLAKLICGLQHPSAGRTSANMIRQANSTAKSHGVGVWPHWNDFRMGRTGAEHSHRKDQQQR